METRQETWEQAWKSRNEVGEVQEIKQLEWSRGVTRYMYNLQRISYTITELSLESLTKVKHSCFVIPLSLLWGFLSNEAMDATVLRALGERGRRHAVIIICSSK